MAKSRPSYRLGRRLKASRKARLDYIVYLQTGGDPTGGRVPDPRVRLKANMGLGGALRMNIFPPVTIRPRFDAGGAVAVAVRILQNVKATITGAGDMAARIAPDG